MKYSLLMWLVLFVVPSTAPACFWDYDTLKDERRGLPGIAEVLAGQWEKHSQFFYQQRAIKMRAQIAAHRDDLAAYDNLAVALEKIGDRDGGISVLLQKEKIAPGQYTTFANMGTIYLHKGEFGPGIECIRKALAINPNAHFGREEYQLKLAQFLLASSTQPTATAVGTTDPTDIVGFPNFLEVNFDGTSLGPGWRSIKRPEIFDSFNLKPNVFDGIVGMLRFGTGESAELYYVLGELLAAKGDTFLAYRAYNRAIEFRHPHSDVIARYMAVMKERAIHKRAFDDDVIASERAFANKWVLEYQKYEDDLIRAGKDTDDETSYAEFYAHHKRALPTLWLLADYRPDESPLLAAGVAVVAVVGFTIIAIIAGRKIRRRWSSSAAAAPAGPAAS